MKSLFVQLAFGAVVSTLLLVLPVHAEAPSDRTENISRLTSELERVRAEIETAQKSLNDSMQSLRARQQELEYSDPELLKLREEMVALEKRVLDLRAQIQVRLKLLPGMKEIEEQRKSHFERIQALREMERGIEADLRAAQGGVAAEK